jgi:hypothetical protein
MSLQQLAQGSACQLRILLPQFPSGTAKRLAVIHASTELIANGFVVPSKKLEIELTQEMSP